MQATEMDFSAPHLTVVDGHHAASVNAPWHVVLSLTGGDATVAFDTPFGIADEFHLCHY